jgi:capsular polysaccharide biosynthesis protein/Mrp family chromosome partitioning ATPase
VSSQSNGANVEFSQYSQVFKRRWYLIVLGILIGSTLAWVAVHYLPKTYESTAAVLVADTGENGSVEGGRTTSSLNLDTEAQIVTSSVVARLAAKDLNSHEEPRDLAKNASVTVPANTSVLEISYKAPTAQEARAGADAFADAYLANRQDLAEKQIKKQRSALQKRIDKLGEELLRVGELVTAQPIGTAQRDYQTTRRTLLVRQIAGINQQLVAVEGIDADPGAIITDPQLPTKPAQPNVMILLASGLLGGLLLGLLLAFAVDRNDRRIRDRRDLERLGLEPLVPFVVVPQAGEIASAVGSRYDAEPMRVLRNSLLAQMPGHRGSVMVAAASAGSEGSAVALNLAATLARSGLEVIFASADSNVGDHRGASDSPGGLAEVILERLNLDEALQTVDGEPGLRTLSPGTDGSLYSELVQSERLQTVLKALALKADILVVDVSPVTQNADAQTLASQFDGVVLVASAKHTTVDDMVEAVDQLRHVSARLFGAVLARQRTQRGSTQMHTTSSA